jgi:hypothetical protein
MSKSSVETPTGQWEMPEEELTSALGQFVLAWSRVEGAIEVAIAKQLGLDAVDGSIVSAGLMFHTRAAILLSLLNRASDKNRVAIGIVGKMQNITDRNDIFHSIIGTNKNQIWFDRRKADGQFKSKREIYDCIRFLKAAMRYSKLADQLLETLDISTEDYVAFFFTAHRAANND